MLLRPNILRTFFEQHEKVSMIIFRLQNLPIEMGITDVVWLKNTVFWHSDLSHSNKALPPYNSCSDLKITLHIKETFH